jgi:uncharacterized protein YraI
MRKLLILGIASIVLAIPIAASAQEAYTTRSVNVRGGPDTTYPPVAVLAPGAPVQVQGCLEDWSWCDVVFANDRGWVYAPYLNYDYQGSRVPFYSYAPSFGIPIVAFSLGSYWDQYYRGRSFYGRRDYWVQRAPPQHFRPSGPPPRATGPTLKERADFRTQDRRTSNSPGFNGNNRATSSNNDSRSNHGQAAAVDNRAGTPSRNVRTPPGQPAMPQKPGAPTEMRRASPTQAAPQGVRGGNAAAANHAPEGNKGRSNEHEGGKEGGKDEHHK